MLITEFVQVIQNIPCSLCERLRVIPDFLSHEYHSKGSYLFAQALYTVFGFLHNRGLVVLLLLQLFFQFLSFLIPPPHEYIANEYNDQVFPLNKWCKNSKYKQMISITFSLIVFLHKLIKNA